MGYESDVKIVYAFPSSKLRTEFLAEATLMLDDPKHAAVLKDLREYIDEHNIDFPDAAPFQLRVHYDAIRWSDHNPQVQGLRKLFKLLNNLADEADDARSGSYYFLRIGETIDDVEAESGGDDLGYSVSDFIAITQYSTFVN